MLDSMPINLITDNYSFRNGEMLYLVMANLVEAVVLSEGSTAKTKTP